MGKRLLIFCAILFITSIFSGQTRISLVAGYGLSQYDYIYYDHVELEQTGYLPAGATGFRANNFAFFLGVTFIL